MKSSYNYSLLSLWCVLGTLMAVTLCLSLLVEWKWMDKPDSLNTTGMKTIATKHSIKGPPWQYGMIDSRFTLIFYADLECPYCKNYYPVLKTWIDQHPEANLQWHHLPLPIHEPAASQQAKIVECAGEVDGPSAFWEAITWTFQHTRSYGDGLPKNVQYSELTTAMRSCLDSTRPEAIILAQASEGSRDGIRATPTVKLRDNLSGHILIISGPLEADALLSAMDLLSADFPATRADITQSTDYVTGNISK